MGREASAWTDRLRRAAKTVGVTGWRQTDRFLDGWPDVLWAAPGGYVGLCELKAQSRPGGRIDFRPGQPARLYELARGGAPCGVAVETGGRDWWWWPVDLDARPRWPLEITQPDAWGWAIGPLTPVELVTAWVAWADSRR